MGALTGRTSPLRFLVLLFFACASSTLQVRLPGVDGSVPLSFAFNFAAITEFPAGPAYFIALLAMVYDAWRAAGRNRFSPGLFINLAHGALTTLVTARVFGFVNAHGSERLLAMGVAAVMYYGAGTSLSALRIWTETGRAPWKVWSEKFFWMGPLYLLVPVATALTDLLRRASGAPDRLVTIALIFGGYRYAKHYFARLHDRDDHARRLDEIRQRTIEALAVSIEAKDGGTSGHLQRVRRHAMLLGERLGCSELEIRTLELGALLHDVGKVCVPDYILGKPGRLSDQEFSQMAEHAHMGAEIVEKVDFPYPVAEIVRNHHEHWDGSGYQRGLCGTQIPLLARILTVVDCFDALVSDRPYRAAVPMDKAIEILREQRGRLLDPEILDAFLELLPSLRPALEQELQRERARLLLDRSPVQQVKQTWLTEQEKTEMVARHNTFERLASSPEQLILLYELLQLLGPAADVDHAFGKALEVLARAVPYDQAAVFSVHGDEFVLTEAAGIPSHCLYRLKVPLFHGVLAQAARAKRPVLAPGPPTEFTTGLHRYLLNARCTLAAPLIAEGHVHGILTLHSRTAGAFQADQAWFVGLITETMARALRAAQEVRKLREEAATDAVTGLPNARATLRRVEQEIERARRQDTSLAVLFLDLNHFKQINDTYGHPAGDAVLAQAAQRLQSCLRPYDFLGRIGGDEFLAILPGMEASALPAKVRALKKAVAQTPITAPDAVQLTTSVSIGAAFYPDDARDPEELLFRSDQRMYTDKEHAQAPAQSAPVLVQ